MAKSQLFDNPVLTAILVHGGAFPVRRGHRDDESMATARSILERGGTVLVYLEGGRSATASSAPRGPGSGRLALETGVPVVPVAIHGSLAIRRRRLPRVTVEYGEAMTFPRAKRRLAQSSRPPIRSSRPCATCSIILCCHEEVVDVEVGWGAWSLSSRAKIGCMS